VINRLNTTRTLLLLLLLALGLAACGPAQSEEEELATLEALAGESDGASASEPAEEQAPEPAEEQASEPVEGTISEPIEGGLSFDLYGGTDAGDFNTTDSGLQYYISEEGDGQVADDGQLLMVNILGWMEDGTEITNSAAFGEPIPLPVGTTTGLIGLDEALTYLSTGSNARFVLPADLVAGPDGAPGPLPPGNVAFVIEVVEIIDGPPEAPQSVDEGDYTVTENGIKLYDLEDGDGPAVESGQHISVHFTGWFEDDTLINSTAGQPPFDFVVGTDQAFPGWNEGLLGMKSGGTRQLVIPPELAVETFGPQGNPDNSVLIFEVEVLEIIEGPPEPPQAVDEGDYTVTDSGLKIYDLEEGDGPVVEPGQQVSVHYTGWLEDGTSFDSSIGSQPFSLVVGTGSVIQGWDEGLLGMKLGGRRQLIIPADLAYGEDGSGPIPPNAVLIFEVEIVDVQ
jgi:peptidylprolyl isomerase